MLLAFGKMSEIRTIINLIEDEDIKGIAIKKFINDVSWDELAHEYCCDRGTLVYKIKKELSKFLHFHNVKGLVCYYDIVEKIRTRESWSFFVSVWQTGATAT